MPPEDHRTQNIALFLIALACVALGIGEWKNWVHLTDFANTFGGGGVGILTGQKLTQAAYGGTNIEKGGHANVNVTAPGLPLTDTAV